eukprot:jgi/Mesen1/7547/ME000392S06804
MDEGKLCGQDTSGLYLVAVHVGAGHHSENNSRFYRKAMQRACYAAIAILSEPGGGGDPLDAVIAAVKVLEDGTVECDASVIGGDGKTFGAVGAAPRIRSAVEVAGQLARRSLRGPLPLGRIPPIFLAGEGAYRWAAEHAPHVTVQSSEELITPAARKQWQRYTCMLSQVAAASAAPAPASQLAVSQLDTCPEHAHMPAAADAPPVTLLGNNATASEAGHTAAPAVERLAAHAKRRRLSAGVSASSPGLSPSRQLALPLERRCDDHHQAAADEDRFMDTVGAVCVDVGGRVAAGVSSGGIAMKVSGRVGEAAQYGAGCWASDASIGSPPLGSSVTGAGEPLMRALFARTTCQAALESEAGPAAACERAVSKLLGSMLDSPAACDGPPPPTDAGVLLVQGQMSASHPPVLESVELVASHSASSFGIGFMSSHMAQPKTTILRRRANQEGQPTVSTFSTVVSRR